MKVNTHFAKLEKAGLVFTRDENVESSPNYHENERGKKKLNC